MIIKSKKTKLEHHLTNEEYQKLVKNGMSHLYVIVDKTDGVKDEPMLVTEVKSFLEQVTEYKPIKPKLKRKSL